VDTPEIFQGFSFDKIEFISRLLGGEPRGTIIGKVALIEWELGTVLASYFTGPSRRFDFSDSVIERLNFEDKICILKKVPLDTPAAELRDRIVAGIRPLQQLRNVAAHAGALKGAQIERIYSDSNKRKLLNDFPKEFEKAVTQIRVWLHELEKSPGFSVAD